MNDACSIAPPPSSLHSLPTQHIAGKLAGLCLREVWASLLLHGMRLSPPPMPHLQEDDSSHEGLHVMTAPEVGKLTIGCQENGSHMTGSKAAQSSVCDCNVLMCQACPSRVTWE